MSEPEEVKHRRLKLTKVVEDFFREKGKWVEKIIREREGKKKKNGNKT